MLEGKKCMSNILYKSDHFCKFYSNNRFKFEEFYLSEKTIFDKVFSRYQRPVEILDMGCGCGGLANALSEKYEISRYVGVDCNKQEIDWAKKNNMSLNICEYVCDDAATYEDDHKYDVVVSLSCIDFNVEVNEMFANCWDKVCLGGYLITSVRLTNEDSINDISRAYQVLDEREKANYVVFNIRDMLKMIDELSNHRADVVEAYGYWHAPSTGTVVEYDKLCMAVFAIHKSENEDHKEKGKVILDLPIDLFWRNER